MRLILGSVSARRTRGKSEPADQLVEEYVARAARMVPTEAAIYPTEAALLEALPRTPSRPSTTLVLFDARGEMLSSEAFAEAIGKLRDTGTQRLLLAIGGADGWTAHAHAQARRVVSFGRITLPHELARVVAAEQIYRALTILAGHPYHGGHA